MLISFKLSLRFRTQFLCCSSVLLIAGVLRVQLDPKEPCRVCWMSLELSRSSWAERLERMHLTPRCPRWPVSSTFNKCMQNLGYKDNQLPVGEGEVLWFSISKQFSNKWPGKDYLPQKWVITGRLCSICKTNVRNKGWGEGWAKTKPQMMKMHRESVKGKTVETNVSLWKQNAAN